MSTDRERRVKLSMAVSLLARFVTLGCGLIVTPLMLKAFGSELYGATASITQFLTFINLLHGGVPGVTRAALYKPLAENDMETVSKILNEVKRFFWVVGSVFAVYVLVLACSFKAISNTDVIDWSTSFLLVVIISFSTFVQYFIGISNNILLSAAQRVYLLQLNTIITTVLNMIMVVVLVRIGSNIVVVKLFSSIVYALSPVLMWIYVKRSFHLVKVKKSNEVFLKQKWTGLGQHIAGYLHSHVDVAVLTVLTNLNLVAVYSVYFMVLENILNIITAVTGGMEAVFGDMLAKKETEQLKKTFDIYDTGVSFLSGTLFTVTTVMIVPFVRIYTDGAEDVNYSRPLFALVFALANYYACVRGPYQAMVIAADRFKQTRKAAYGEAIINAVLSVVLVIRYDLVGVAIGTLVADLFRFVYYAYYLSKHVLCFAPSGFIKRFAVNMVDYALSCATGFFFVKFFTITDYFSWALAASVITLISLTIHSFSAFLFYRQHLRDLKNVILKRKKPVVESL